MTVGKSEKKVESDHSRRFLKKIKGDTLLLEALANPSYKEVVLEELAGSTYFLKRATNNSYIFVSLLESYPQLRPKLIKKLLHHPSLFRRMINSRYTFLEVVQYNLYRDELFAKLFDHPKLFCKVTASNLEFTEFLQTFPNYLDDIFSAALRHKSLLLTVLGTVCQIILFLETYPQYTDALMQKLLGDDKLFAEIVKEFYFVLDLMTSFPRYQIALAQKGLIAQGISPTRPSYQYMLTQFPHLEAVLLEFTLNNESLYWRYVRGCPDNMPPEEVDFLFSEERLVKNINKYPGLSKKIWQVELLFFFPVLLKKAIAEQDQYTTTPVEKFIEALINHHRLEFSVIKFILPLLNEALAITGSQQTERSVRLHARLEVMKKSIFQNQKLSLVDLCIDKLKSVLKSDLIPTEELKDRADTFVQTQPGCIRLR